MRWTGGPDMSIRRIHLGRLELGSMVLVLLLGACAPAVALPPDSASPEVVLDTYLRALVAGDCAIGHKLAVGTFSTSNGDLCGSTQVKAYGILGAPAQPTTDEEVFATTLTTTGTADGTLPAGQITWFYALDRQPNGSWRISGGGSGP